MNVEMPMPTPERHLIVNSIWNLVAYASTILVGVIAIPIYVHVLGIREYGLIVILNSILVPIGLLNLGFGEATIKYVSESVGKGDTRAASIFVRVTLLFNLVGGLVGMILIAALAQWLARSAFNIEPSYQQLAQTAFYWIAVSWLINEVSGTYLAVPTALQRYSIVAIGNGFGNSIGVILGLVTVLLGGGVLALIQVRVVWSFLVMIFWAVCAKRLLPELTLLPGWDRTAFRHSARYGFWQTAAGLGGLIANQTDKFILGIYLPTASVGVYNIALTIQVTVYSAIYKLAEVLFPAISNLQGRGEQRRAVELMLRSGWLLSLLTVTIMGTVAVFAHELLYLYVGSEIAGSISWLLQILVVASMLSSGSVAIAQYLMGVGKTQWMAATAFASGIIVLGVGLLLVPRYGLMGVGWAQILAILLSRPIIHAWFWQSSLRQIVSAKVYFSYLYGPAVISVTYTLLLVIARAWFVWSPSLLGLAVACIVFATTLLGIVILIDRLLPGSKERYSDLLNLIKILLVRVRCALRLHKPTIKVNRT